VIDRTDTKYVIVSASGTPPAMDFGAQRLALWYEGKRSRFFCPWHFVIRRNGKVEEGRSVQYRGEAPHGFKAISLSVLLVGGQSEVKYCRPSPNYSNEQRAALESLLRRLSARYPGVKILGLSQVPGVEIRSNPGFDVAAWASSRDITTSKESSDGATNPPHSGTGAGVQLGDLADLQAFHGEDRSA
jgi:N-acetylmuramoyl-L-alanine amidase